MIKNLYGTSKATVNNEIYKHLGDKWYLEDHDPIAILRAENVLKDLFIQNSLMALQGNKANTILDVGCGGGLLTNSLAKAGYTVTGIDVAENALEMAKKYDATGSVRYQKANAYELPFGPQSFDCVCIMDFLEHVEFPAQVIKEASRVLKHKGSLFFHTFNRNLLTWLIVIKGIDWFVPNATKDMHLYRCFITPQEMQDLVERFNMQICHLCGIAPRLFSKAVLKLLLTRKVPKDFEFQYKKSLVLGYLGHARKL